MSLKIQLDYNILVIIPSTLNDGLSEVLNKIDQELVDMRSKYKDNDESIIRLKREKIK